MMCAGLSRVFSTVTGCVCVSYFYARRHNSPLLWQPQLLSMTHSLSRTHTHTHTHCRAHVAGAHLFGNTFFYYYFKPPTLDYRLYLHIFIHGIDLHENLLIWFWSFLIWYVVVTTQWVKHVYLWCPWARHLTPSCSRRATSDIYSTCKSLWIKASAKWININHECKCADMNAEVQLFSQTHSTGITNTWHSMCRGPYWSHRNYRLASAIGQN